MAESLTTKIKSLLSLITKKKHAEHQVPVVQKMDNAIHRINHYPVDKCCQNKLRYPLDSDLSGG